MDKNRLKLETILDLFDAGYKNAYVSVVDFNFGAMQIEIILQNVGTLRLDQSFSESNDDQCPHFDVFYTMANNPNIIQKIENKDVLYRAIRIAYNCKRYFEQHPEYIIGNEKDLIKRIHKNKNMIQKFYKTNQKTRNRWLSIFDKEK